MDDAAEPRGVSGRQVRLHCMRCVEEGEDASCDRRSGSVSPRRVPESELAPMRRLYREEYAGFATKHFHEELHKRHGNRLGYTVMRLAPQEAGLARPPSRHSKHCIVGIRTLQEPTTSIVAGHAFRGPSAGIRHDHPAVYRWHAAGTVSDRSLAQRASLIRRCLAPDPAFRVCAPPS